MIGRKAVVGLSLLSALLFCAFAAQSASATVTTSKNTTAFTCDPSASVKQFTKAHCDFGDTGGSAFGHTLISGTTTGVDAVNTGVKNGTTESVPAVLKGKVALSETEITCTTVKNNTTTSSLENSEPVVGEHTLKGFAEIEYSNCTVNKPAKCIVAEPIIAKANVHGVEGLTGPNGEATEKENAMALEYIGAGLNETFVEIEYKDKVTPPETCALKGQKFPVKGKVYGTSGPEELSVQNQKESGTTQLFTPNFGMEELTLGGNAAKFTSIVTVKMAGGNGIGATTTT